MGRRKKELTQEQLEWRSGILRGNIKAVKISTPVSSAHLSEDDKINQCFYYLNNCVFWVNEYIDGRVNKSRLLETAKAIQGNAQKLEKLLNTNQPNNKEDE